VLLFPFMLPSRIHQPLSLVYLTWHYYLLSNESLIYISESFSLPIVIIFFYLALKSNSYPLTGPPKSRSLKILLLSLLLCSSWGLLSYSYSGNRKTMKIIPMLNMWFYLIFCKMNNNSFEEMKERQTILLMIFLKTPKPSPRSWIV